MADRYREVYEGFRWNVPADFNIAQWACRRWAKDRHRLALYWEDESGETQAWTYWDLQQSANRLSNALAALGISRGDRVALILPQRPETIVAYFACFQMGAIAVPLSFLFGPEALEYRLANSGAKVAVVDAQTLRHLESVRASLPDLAHVIGAAGAKGDRVLDWDETLAKASRHFTPVVAPRRAIPRRSSTRAAPPARPRARCCRNPRSSATCPVSSIRTTASRRRATSSGRRPTGRGRADCGMRSCRRSITGRPSSVIAAASIRSARFTFSRSTRCATPSSFPPRSR